MPTIDENSITNQLEIVDKLKVELNTIKDKIKVGGLNNVVFDTLSQDAKRLQDKIDEILSKKGVLTQSDINDAYTTMQSVKRGELEKMSNDSKRNFFIYLGIGALFIYGLYYYNKKK
jgi:hypothetical protein